MAMVIAEVWTGAFWSEVNKRGTQLADSLRMPNPLVKIITNVFFRHIRNFCYLFNLNLAVLQYHLVAFLDVIGTGCRFLPFQAGVYDHV